MNIIVLDSCWEREDIDQLYNTGSNDKKTYDAPFLFIEEQSLPKLLVRLGFFPSTSQAIKAGRKGMIEKGWSEVKASGKGHKLWIWNPTKYTTDSETGSFAAYILSLISTETMSL